MKVIWRNTLLVAGAFMAGGIGGALYDDGPVSYTHLDVYKRQL